MRACESFWNESFASSDLRRIMCVIISIIKHLKNDIWSGLYSLVCHRQYILYKGVFPQAPRYTKILEIERKEEVKSLYLNAKAMSLSQAAA